MIGLEKQNSSTMRKIEIAVTANRTDVEHQFKGTITFKNEKNNEVILNYTATDPKEPEVNLEFSGDNEEFQMKGIP